jgi:dTDP-4-amino-4,6-dideoxygalactose transaminase
MPSLELRQEFITRMKADGIATPFHYVPLHNSPAGLRFARTSGVLSYTQDVSSRLVRLPLFPRMGDASQRVLERAEAHLNQLL